MNNEHHQIDSHEIDRMVATFKDEGNRRVKLVFSDIDGVLRGKYVSVEKFASIAKKGGTFCDVIFGWDVEDQLYDRNNLITGWKTGYPDGHFKVDLSTLRRLRDEKNLPMFIGEFVDNDQKSPHPVCPRSLLRRVLKRAEDMGYKARSAFEYEFFIFDETPHSVREKNYQNLKPFTPGNFGYSVIRPSVYSDIFNEFMGYCMSLDMTIEGLHCETGPGVWEAAIDHDTALRAADKASLFKTFTKVFFQKREKMATFMAKWSMDYPGQSGHVHQSLYDKSSGEALFFNQQNYAHMSETMQHYVAGQMKYMRSFLAMSSPTINSYTRLVKGAWAPTNVTWGVDNRTTSLRVIPGDIKSQRVEYRVGSADGNPYLVVSALIAAGLLGIEQKLSLGDEIKGNAYSAHLPADVPSLPSNLRDAADLLRESSEAKDWFGETFVNHFVESRLWEAEEYEKQVTDWQLRRYFEII